MEIKLIFGAAQMVQGTVPTPRLCVSDARFPNKEDSQACWNPFSFPTAGHYSAALTCSLIFENGGGIILALSHQSFCIALHYSARQLSAASHSQPLQSQPFLSISLLPCPRTFIIFWRRVRGIFHRTESP